MNSKGEQVVCVRDDFDATIRRLYTELPKKGCVYTVREVDIGRVKPTFNPSGKNEIDWMLLLEELHNPVDIIGNSNKEMGFSASRFRPYDPMVEQEEVEIAEPEPMRELVHVWPEEDADWWKKAE